MVKSIINDETYMGSEAHDFNVCDSRGRLIGAVIYYREIELVEAAPETRSWYNHPAGYWYTATMQATRDGKPYGASQTRRWFATEAEREAAVNKYLADARKRVEKAAA